MRRSPPAYPSYLIQVANTGDFALSNVALTDTLLDTSGCELPDTLQPGDIAECTVGPLTAADGQTVNTVLATAQHNGVTLTATDSAYAFAGDIAVLHIEKMAGLGVFASRSVTTAPRRSPILH
jgi:hypothetical protein